MTTDRAAEASAEAERRYPESWDHYNDEPVDDWGYSECQREAFCAGMAWADANPKPHTITEKRLREFTLFVLDQADDARGVRHAVAHLLGVEVEDDDE